MDTSPPQDSDPSFQSYFEIVILDDDDRSTEKTNVNNETTQIKKITSTSSNFKHKNSNSNNNNTKIKKFTSKPSNFKFKNVNTAKKKVKKTSDKPNQEQDTNEITVITIDDESSSDEVIKEKINPFMEHLLYCATCKESTKKHKSEIRNCKKYFCKKCKTKLLFVCSFCKRKYESKLNVYIHTQSRFDCRNLPDLHCSQCDYISGSKKFLEKHIEKYHVEFMGLNDLIACKKCGRHFTRKSAAKVHELICGLPTLECPLCEFSANNLTGFKYHMTNTHIIDPSKDSAIIDNDMKLINISNDPDINFFYETDKVFGIKWLEEQQGKLEEAINKIKALKKKNYLDLNGRCIMKMYCYKCKETTAIRPKKKIKCSQCEAYLIHECGLCSSKFNTFLNLFRHIQDKHIDPDILNVYVCAKCNKQYKIFKQLLTHKRSNCGSNFNCDLCPFQGISELNIKYHKNKWHEGPAKDRHHPCTICGKQLKYFGEKEINKCYSCQICT